jgi:hypothetical protein
MPQPTYFEALFYADCISYEHDLPSMVYPSKGEVASFLYRYAYSGPTKPQEISILKEETGTITKMIRKPFDPREVARNSYIDQVIAILELTRELRHGPMTFILFRTYDNEGATDLPYSARYGSLSKELGLYASALKQPDALSEYLFYYRIIESVSQSNGKQWIEDNLGRISTSKFGRVAIAHEMDEYSAKPKNLLSIYRRRALIRYQKLLRRLGTNKAISRYLYEVNRCGIAHGKGSVLKSQLLPSYFEVGKDSTILKMLTRIAIDERAT